jgi:hypothetical protein
MQYLILNYVNYILVHFRRSIDNWTSHKYTLVWGVKNNLQNMVSQVRKDFPRLIQFAFPIKLKFLTVLYPIIQQRWANKLCFKVRKFLGSFRYRKSEIFLSVPVRKFFWLIRKSQIHKFLQKNALLCFKTVLKVDFLYDIDMFYFVQIWIRALSAIFSNRINMFLQTCGSFTNRKKDLYR